MFCLGASSLQLFVQSNWLGCHSQHLDSLIEVESIEKELALDGECLIPSMKNLPCLLIAKVILHDLKHKFQSFKVIPVFFFLVLLSNFDWIRFYFFKFLAFKLVDASLFICASEGIGRIFTDSPLSTSEWCRYWFPWKRTGWKSNVQILIIHGIGLLLPALQRSRIGKAEFPNSFTSCRIWNRMGR